MEWCAAWPHSIDEFVPRDGSICAPSDATDFKFHGRGLSSVYEWQENTHGHHSTNVMDSILAHICARYRLARPISRQIPQILAKKNVAGPLGLYKRRRMLTP